MNGPTSQETVVILEFVPTQAAEPFQLSRLEGMIEELRPWHPLVLWNSDRYAVQLQLPTRDPHEALDWAFAYHGAAAAATGVSGATFVRAELLTTEEHDRTFRDWDEVGADDSAVLTPGVLCDELYEATRRLHAAPTPAGIADAVTSFVTEMGGQVEAGPPCDLPDTIDVDISIEADRRQHASAEACSVAGLVLEQALPALLADARRALARLGQSRSLPSD